MSIVAEQYTHIVGVDTHARTHTYAVMASVTGQVTDTATFPTSPPGIARALTWLGRRSPAGRTLVAVEGASSYGAGLTRALETAGVDVCDVKRPRRASRAGSGKSDEIDAAAAARAVAGIDTSLLLRPRTGANATPCGFCSTPAAAWTGNAPPTATRSLPWCAPWTWASTRARPWPTPRSAP